jgi:hypothetical protein
MHLTEAVYADWSGQIQELKSTMASEIGGVGSGDIEDEENVDLVLGVHPASDVQELLSLLPPRPEIDRILSLYFSAKWLIFRCVSFHLDTSKSC